MITVPVTKFIGVNSPQAQAQAVQTLLASLANSLAQWRQHPRAQRTALAFSGGLDSTVLLHALAQLAKRGTEAGDIPSCTLEAIHVDHGLHPDSARWAAHCLQFAQQLGVSATHLTVAVENVGLGLEDAARRARYQAIAEYTGPNVLLLTAQHQADQAETVLMKILSGAGTRGAVGMQDFSERAGFLLARPLLGVSKAQIIEYATHHGLSWLEDPSNQSPQFRRNRIRQLMPELRAIYPDAELTLSQYAEQARADRELLELQAKQALARCQSLDPAVLRLDAWHLETPALRAWIARAWLAAQGVHNPALVRASLALANSASAYGEVKTRQKSAAYARSAPGNDYVRRFDNCLYYAAGTATARIAPTLWQAHNPLMLGNLGSLQFDTSSPAISQSRWIVSQRLGGERIQLPARIKQGKPYRHALKDILQQQRVPPWRRNQLILLAFADTGELACVLGHCASARFQDWLETHATRLVHNN